MKQVNFLLAALLMTLTGVSFTSCLDSEDEITVVQVEGVLRTLDHGATFTDGSAYTLVPNPVYSLDGEMYLVSFSYDTEQMYSSLVVDIELDGEPYCIDGPDVISGEVENDLSIYSLLNAPFFFDKNTLIFSCMYWSKSGMESQSEILAEAKRHEFYLYYDPDAISSDSSTLDLHVAHCLLDDNGSNYTSIEYEYRAWNIEEALEAFINKYGKEPVQISLYYLQNRSSSSVDNGDPSEEKYILSY